MSAILSGGAAGLRPVAVGLVLLSLLAASLAMQRPVEKTLRAESAPSARVLRLVRRCTGETLWKRNILVEAISLEDARQHLAEANPGCEFRLQPRRRKRRRGIFR